MQCSNIKCCNIIGIHSSFDWHSTFQCQRLCGIGFNHLCNCFWYNNRLSMASEYSLAVTWRGLSIADVLDLTVDAGLAMFEAHAKIYDPLRALHDVGLGYLRLGQAAPTLSGGEAQRVRLARELTRRGTDRTLYVLDEPSAGLHPGDVEVLAHLLERLVAQGSTVVVIEHDTALIALADHVVDIGPGAGPDGGDVVVEGDLATVLASPVSRTAEALRRAQRP